MQVLPREMTCSPQYLLADVRSFGALLVQTFPEVSTERALVLLMPAAAVAVVVILLSGYVTPASSTPSHLLLTECRILSTMFPRRRITIGISFLIPTVIGNVLLWKLHGDRLSPLLAGLYLVSALKTCLL